jgi:hypothetical protein
MNSYIKPKQYITIDILKYLEYVKFPLLFLIILILFGTIFLAFGISSALAHVPLILLLYYLYPTMTTKMIYILQLIGLIVASGVIMNYIYTSNKFGNDSTQYEGFAESSEPTTKEIKETKEMLEDALQELDVIGEETCNILNSVESKFMENATVPQTDESKLSETTKQTMKQRRIEKGKKDWATKKEEFLQKKKGSSFAECFANEEDEERIVLIQELKDLLSSPTVSNLDNKLAKYNLTNEFSIEYSNKFGKDVSKILPESFVDMDTKQIISTAKKLIEKIMKSKELMENARKNSSFVDNLTSNPNTISNILTN